MPNWEKPGRDSPSKQDVRRMEKEDKERETRYNKEQNRVDMYLLNHPNASRAEALYKTKK